MTVEFKLNGEDGIVLDAQLNRLKRMIVWRPVIVDLWDTRLPRGEQRTYTFTIDADAEPAPVTLDIMVCCHLLDEARRRRIDYENQEPISYVVFQQSIPLTEHVALQRRPVPE